MELFCGKVFLQNSQENTCAGVILIRLQVSILQLQWNKGLSHSRILMSFARYVRHLFYITPGGDCFCSTEKYFANKIVKNPLRKGKNGNTLWEEQRNKNLVIVYIKSSYPFYRDRLLHPHWYLNFRYPAPHLKLSSEDLNPRLMILISGQVFEFGLVD